ncbi:MAG TPA: cytochrome C oxidase subunit IV family protein, partial [Burkholderiaceae bacterium]|nr:cytochrome C oxidase subunit IV family protein [Burkholderiaceae bacterium]
ISWCALLALLALTLGSAYVPLGWLNTVINLTISITQAAIVLLFSMHLRFAHPTLRVVAGSGFFGIAILIALSLSDVLTR